MDVFHTRSFLLSIPPLFHYFFFSSFFSKFQNFRSRLREVGDTKIWSTVESYSMYKRIRSTILHIDTDEVKSFNLSCEGFISIR